MANSLTACGRWLLVLALCAGMASAHAACAPQCAATSSVTTMAGTRPQPLRAADDIVFAGTRLTPPGVDAAKRVAKDALQEVARVQAPRNKWTLNLTVRADHGLVGAPARAQIKARTAALTRVLVVAGIERCHINGRCRP